MEKPEDPNDIDEVYDTLLSLVRHSLGNDPALLPPACMPHKEDGEPEENIDNFMFDSKGQARMLSAAIAAVCFSFIPPICGCILIYSITVLRR